MAAFTLFFFSCKKEFSFESGQISEGFPEKDVNNNCLPATVKGNYVSGQTLNGNNYIRVQSYFQQFYSTRDASKELESLLRPIGKFERVQGSNQFN